MDFLELVERGLTGAAVTNGKWFDAPDDFDYV